jgi:hypothetical protein
MVRAYRFYFPAGQTGLRESGSKFWPTAEAKAGRQPGMSRRGAAETHVPGLYPVAAPHLCGGRSALALRKKSRSRSMRFSAGHQQRRFRRECRDSMPPSISLPCLRWFQMVQFD